LGWLLRAELAGRLAVFILRSLGRPRFQAFSLFAVGLLMTFGWTWWLNRRDLPSTDGPFSEEPTSTKASPPQPIALTAQTDRGSTIPLYRMASSKDELFTTEHLERLVKGPYHLKLLATRKAGAESNCHGWVFTDGRFWIRGKDLDHILSDN